VLAQRAPAAGSPLLQNYPGGLECGSEGILHQGGPGGAYKEAPTWDKTGIVAISGGWKPDFKGQDCITSMYAPGRPAGEG
jgi:hypothetical protein